jgi:putative flippase GtrA
MGAIVSYLLNYHYTFKSNNSHLGAAVRFSIVCGIALLLNGAIMSVLVHSLGAIYLLAQVIATALVLVWNFLGSALWTFARAEQRIGQG